MKGRIAIAVALLCLAAAGAALAAVAGAPAAVAGAPAAVAGAPAAVRGASAIPIAGLSGPAIQVAGAQRTNDGGGILAARIPDRLGSPRGRILIARLEADGALNLAYGGEGLSTLPLGPSLQLTALAIDPASGDAWIGTRIGPHGPGQIVALDGSGALRASFGRHGVVRLPAADDGGPVALAWRRGALLVAAGDTPCRGCSLSIRDPAGGRLIAATGLSPSELMPAGCTGTPALASAVFVGAHIELTTREPARSQCPALIVGLGRGLQPAASAGPTPPSLPAARATSIVISTSNAGSCIASADSTRIAISPYTSASTGGVAAAPGGTLVALVPLGPGSCAALIDTPRGRGTVAQMSNGDRRTITDGLPRALAPLTMFRCHQHLLVVGATGRRAEAAVIVPVPVRRGRFAARHASAAVAASSTGCS